jgi:hypothetical protein
MNFQAGDDLGSGMPAGERAAAPFFRCAGNGIDGGSRHSFYLALLIGSLSNIMVTYYTSFHWMSIPNSSSTRGSAHRKKFGSSWRSMRYFAIGTRPSQVLFRRGKQGGPSKTSALLTAAERAREIADIPCRAAPPGALSARAELGFRSPYGGQIMRAAPSLRPLVMRSAEERA